MPRLLRTKEHNFSILKVQNFLSMHLYFTEVAFSVWKPYSYVLLKFVEYNTLVFHKKYFVLSYNETNI